MKIMIALHKCMDLGGIINHTEQLIGGLKDEGHQVHLCEFVWSDKAHGNLKTGDFMTGPSGTPYNQGKGWNFHSDQRIAYKGPANLYQAKQLLNEYDMVVWTVPVPSKNKDNMGNSDWVELYDLDPKVKQIAFIHDGNASKGSSHMIAIQHKLTAIACVHPCAVNGARIFSPPRALVVNPQFNPVRATYGWNEKQTGFVNMQTFKAWKHVHELVEAVAYLPDKHKDELREIAGMGIEYRYMTSEDKCKPQYFHPESDRWFSEQKMWYVALMNGMSHHDYWNDDEVDMWLKQARVLVDPSWSNNYSQNGGHFNRVVVDAMIRGAIPVARRLGMGDEVFKAGQHYVEIPQSASAQEYADIILEASYMPESKAQEMRNENVSLLPMFDRRVVARRLVKLAHGDVLDAITHYEIPESVHEKACDVLFNHFGVIH